MKHTILLIFVIIALSLPLTAGAPATKEILLGRFVPAKNDYFSRIEDAHTDKYNIYMQTEVYDAYRKMRQAAAADGITLTIISATRTFDSQRSIWLRKWNNLSGTDSVRVRQIMRYSSMPGTSRHHWGTDLDFISVENAYWTHGEGLKAYNWLKANAHKYGFYQPYTADPNRTGYAEERWHWSYLPIAAQYTYLYSTMITANDISGFPGAELAIPLNVITTHVMGVDGIERITAIGNSITLWK